MTDTTSLPLPIFSISRNEIKETIVYGETFILHNDELIYGRKNILPNKFMCRSIIKPWQFEAMQIGDQRDFWSLCFASHSYQSIHEGAINNLLKATSIDEQQIQCPIDYPLDQKTKYNLISNQSPETKRYHQCSGKHIGYIHSCQLNNYEESSYLEADHPINKRFFSNIKDLSNEIPSHGVDGCLNAAPGLSYKGFLNLCNETLKKPSEKMQLCFDLWSSNPRLVGGINRLDSDISEDLGGGFLAKEGADGLLLILNPKEKITILTKVYHGNKKEWIIMALWSALKLMKSKNKELSKLKDYMTIKLRDSLKDNQTFNIFPP